MSKSQTRGVKSPKKNQQEQVQQEENNTIVTPEVETPEVDITDHTSMLKTLHNPDSKFYGNQDTEKKYPFPRQFADHFYVRHFRVEKMPSGAMVEDPGSSRFQYYTPDDFEKLSKQPVKDGKQRPSQFDLAGLSTEVLHDPTK
jgi:hypothetical protein